MMSPTDELVLEYKRILGKAEKDLRDSESALKFANATIDRLRKWIGENEWVDFYDQNSAFFDSEGH